MSQEFHILRCCSCETFQVHQVKKSKKWQCKVCNQQQSIKMVFGRGSGINCRKHVQKLNLLRGQTKRDDEKNLLSDLNITCSKENEEPTDCLTKRNVDTVNNTENGMNQQSKWVKFLDEQKLDDNEVNDSIETGLKTNEMDHNVNKSHSPRNTPNTNHKRKLEVAQSETNYKKLKDMAAISPNGSKNMTTLHVQNDEEWRHSNELATDPDKSYSLNSELSFLKESPDCASLEGAVNDSIDLNSKWHKFL